MQALVYIQTAEHTVLSDEDLKEIYPSSIGFNDIPYVSKVDVVVVSNIRTVAQAYDIANATMFGSILKVEMVPETTT